MEPERFKPENTIVIPAQSVADIHALLNVLRFNLTEIGAHASKLDSLYVARGATERAKQVKELLKSHEVLVQQMNGFEISFWEVLKG